ncbi:MAG: PTS sugar transporter subunit IIA [Deltaproteobacteria bacterium]|nr:PTS sugar transporter subunit IIA [Deltaproteobacteria bacterium]MBW2020246.1 PTS sugar transporter subunit IIA [Deltaproteobacteria bacterium]MBW2075015.1 PTS sugar transporter subunit IIA [Deltaproteobacteria bacterium]
MPVSTLQRWIRQGKIPVYKSKGGYVFLEKDLKRWAESHHIVFASESSQPVRRNSAQTCSLLLAMKKGGVLHGVGGNDVSRVLKAVVKAAPLDPSIDRNELFVRLIEREELSTTGIGNGVAIPHPRSPLENAPLEPCITTCFLNTPVNYGAIDAIPVFVLFLMLSPSPKIHLRLLAKLSHLLRNSSFVDFLRGKPSASDLFAMVDEMETGIDMAYRPSRPRSGLLR